MPRYFKTNSITPSLIASLGTVAFRPRTFFEKLEHTEEYRNSVIFLSLILFIPALAESYTISQEKMASILPALEGLGLLLAWFWAGYLYWCIRLFTKHELEHASAFQLAAYSNVPLLLDFTPLMIVPAFIWQLFITWRGLVHHVGIPANTATAFMAIPVIMLLAAAIAFIMLMALSGIDLVTPFLEDTPAQNQRH